MNRDYNFTHEKSKRRLLKSYTVKGSCYDLDDLFLSRN